MLKCAHRLNRNAHLTQETLSKISFSLAELYAKKNVEKVHVKKVTFGQIFILIFEMDLPL